jgi:uncharacterized protein (DUF427 family)
MATARWNGVVLAESDHCHIVEGNYYFPPDSLRHEYLRLSRAHSLCFWKGLASYYHLEVDGARNHNAAWIILLPPSWPGASKTMSRFGTAWKSNLSG